MERAVVEAEVQRLEEAVGRLRAALGEARAEEAGAVPATEGWDVSGLWQGTLTEEDERHFMTLQVHAAGGRVGGAMTIIYELGEETYVAVENLAGTIDGRNISLAGTRCTFIPPDPDADYPLDLLELTMFAKGAEMSGKWSDAGGDTSGRAELKRVES